MNPSDGSAVITTLTGGIQDVAALLPLLGTDQCEDHVTSALTNGYLYAAATPISIFGSLGIARAGLLTFFASFSIPKWNIFGARTLMHMGFQPKGTNLSLIMIDSSDKERYLMINHFDNLLKESHIDHPKKIISVSSKSTKWNVVMALLTALFSLLSLVPYIYLNIRGNSTLSPLTRWSFLVLRALGCFLTTVVIQLVVRTRITALTKRRLDLRPDKGHIADERHLDDSKLEGVDSGNSFLTWLLLLILLVGSVASVAGYVGSFSVVQSAESFTGPLTWLCLEAGLSLIRLSIWGYNPMSDDAPPMECVLKLDPHVPFPTCMKYDDEILEDKVLPLTRASQFLESITSFTGLLNRFVNPDLTLYYTLVRKKFDDHETPPKPGERVLYITIFDHKDRTTRIYTRDSKEECFYQTQSNASSIHIKHGLLETSLAEKSDYQSDAVLRNQDVLSQLRDHHKSILDGIQDAMDRRSCNDRVYVIKNTWTMKFPGTISTWKSKATPKGDDEGSFDREYLHQGLLERWRRRVLLQDGVRIDRCMKDMEPNWSKEAECKTLFAMMYGYTREVKTMDQSYESRLEIVQALEMLLIHERYQMETLLMDGIKAWERKLLHEMRTVLRDKNLENLEKNRFVDQWRMACWRRLDADMCAMDARIEATKLAFEARTNDSDSKDFKMIWQDMERKLRNDIKAEWISIKKTYVYGSAASLFSHSELPNRDDRFFASANSSSLPATRLKVDSKKVERRLVGFQKDIWSGLNTEVFKESQRDLTTQRNHQPIAQFRFKRNMRDHAKSFAK